MTATNFKTEIKELDKILGVENRATVMKSKESQEPESNDKIILIKGGPGSGKTTLGLQILNNNLKNSKCDVVGYVSLELDKDTSVNYAANSFNFEYLVEKKEGKTNLKSTSKEKLHKSIEKFYNPESSHPPKISDVLCDCLDLDTKKDQSTIIFIDSLNILIDIIRSVVDVRINERDIIKSICDINRKKNIIYIFSVEYHPALGESKVAISESFMCDIDILLNVEPIFHAAQKTSPNISSIGYNIEGNLKGGKENEYRSFCRVLKTRFDNHQTRRCAYDIVTGTGIKFYESFPGDGQVSLFYENSKQREAWEDFFIEDIPHQFPSLRHERFDRKQMQQNYSNRRRFNFLPEKTDLYLSSYDNYWIHAFTNVERKTFIREFILDKSGIFKELMENGFNKDQIKQTEKFKNFINKLTNFFLKNPLNIPNSEIAKKAGTKPSVSLGIKIEKPDVINRFETKVKFISGTKQTFAIEVKKAFQKIYTCKVQNSCIKNVSKLLFTIFEEKEINKYSINTNDNDVCIIRNNAGVILFFVNREGTLTKLVTFDSWHKQLEFILKYEAKKMLYNTTYRSKFISEDIIGSKAKKLPEEKNDILIISNDKIETQTTENICIDAFNYPLIQNILNQFYIDELENRIQKAKNEFSNSRGLGCIACNCLKKIDSRINSNTKNHDELINDVLKSIIYRQINQNGINCKYNDVNKISYGDPATANHSSCYWYKRIKSELNDDKLLAYFKNIIINELFNIDDLTKVFENYLGKKTYEIYKDLIQKDIKNLFIELLKYSEQKSFLATIEKKDLKLFGERQSDFIEELSDSTQNHRPIHHRKLLFGLYNSDSYLSIPYNANVGMFVYRKDILEPFYKKIFNKENNKARQDYTSIIFDICQHQCSALGIPNKLELKSEQLDKLISNSIIDLYPKTWEEIFAIYQFYRIRDKKMDLVFDSKTTDTYYSFFLELLWNCGGKLEINADYSIVNEKDTVEKLMQAYYLLGYMYYSGIIPDNSSAQPEAFSQRYNNGKNEWIFARFWYSTFVELINARQNIPESSNGENEKFDEGKFSWNPIKDNKLGLMPMPVTLSKYLETGNPANVEHCTAWGDWHLGVIHGSENLKLAADIINHLMSSRKIVENAYSNAILPTTKDFYTLYKNSRCFSPSKRDKLTLPDTTFKEIRTNYFKYAQSRSQVYDFRHCMVELNTVLKYVENIAFRNSKFTGFEYGLPTHMVHGIRHSLEHALKGIQELVNI